MNSFSELKHLVSSIPKEVNFQSYLCFEQAGTIDLLNYISTQQSFDLKQQQINKKVEGEDQHKKSIVKFNSDQTSQQNSTIKNRKQKEFTFDRIFMHQQKMKHYFSKQINQICTKAISGLNQTVLIYGTEEKSKDKLVFGQPQNPGLFLCVISEIFSYCHHKGLEDLITLKLSTKIHKNGKFIDLFTKGQQVFLYKDEIQKLISDTSPEIIIRNVKTGLKILNIILKIIKETRETDLTENIILTLKVQIDWEKNKQNNKKGQRSQETTVYCMSKINFIKLSNPSIKSSLMGVTKDNIWFVNLFNLLQQASSDKNMKNLIDEKMLDNFTQYLKKCILQSSHNIYCLTSVTNKMTSNECLTSLLFSNYLKLLKFQPQQRIIVDLKKLEKKIEQLPSLLKLVNLQKNTNIVSPLKRFLRKILESQNLRNYLEYEYSLSIGSACEKLNKYIFTEELEDFYYAKKISIEADDDLLDAFATVQKITKEVVALKNKLLKIIEYQIQKNSFHFPPINVHNIHTVPALLEKVAIILQKLLTMASHFLLSEEQCHFILIQLGLNSNLDDYSDEQPEKLRYNHGTQDQNNKLYLKEGNVPLQCDQLITNNQTNTNPFLLYQSQNQTNKEKQSGHKQSQSAIRKNVEKIENLSRVNKQCGKNINMNSLKTITEREKQNDKSVIKERNKNKLPSESLEKPEYTQIKQSSNSVEAKINRFNQTKGNSVDQNWFRRGSDQKKGCFMNRASPPKDDLTYMFTNKNVGIKDKNQRI